MPAGAILYVAIGTKWLYTNSVEHGQTAQQINVTAAGKYWVKATNKCGVYSDTIQIRTVADYAPALPDDTVNAMQQIGLYSLCLRCYRA